MITVILRPPGRGNHSPVVVTFDTARRSEQPLPVSIRRGDLWKLNGVDYRVSRVRVQA